MEVFTVYAKTGMASSLWSDWVGKDDEKFGQLAVVAWYCKCSTDAQVLSWKECRSDRIRIAITSKCA